ncbi:MAG: tRNA-(ms[2]io[6]A)-hydroxylase [Pseudomonadales bacterium]|nr:tRNA-(ms[2]io[6]A)-hydroxylase [Pseudomonadales bacterium]
MSNTTINTNIEPNHFQVSDKPLRFVTPIKWVNTVMDDFDTFLQDHAAAEKKASSMAMSMISHYPNRIALVEAMAALAVEELNHFREVIKWLHRRDIQLTADNKDHYVIAMRKHMRNGSDVYLLDRLLIGGIIEARGCERFGMVADALPEGDLQNFYRAITQSEAKHYQLFIDLAHQYFAAEVVNERLDTLLDIEAKITADLIISAALH